MESPLSERLTAAANAAATTATSASADAVACNCFVQGEAGDEGSTNHLRRSVKGNAAHIRQQTAAGSRGDAGVGSGLSSCDSERPWESVTDVLTSARSVGSQGEQQTETNESKGHGRWLRLPLESDQVGSEAGHGDRVDCPQNERLPKGKCDEPSCVGYGDGPVWTRPSNSLCTLSEEGLCAVLGAQSKVVSWEQSADEEQGLDGNEQLQEVTRVAEGSSKAVEAVVEWLGESAALVSQESLEATVDLLARLLGILHRVIYGSIDLVDGTAGRVGSRRATAAAALEDAGNVVQRLLGTGAQVVAQRVSGIGNGLLSGGDGLDAIGHLRHGRQAVVWADARTRTLLGMLARCSRRGLRRSIV